MTYFFLSALITLIALVASFFALRLLIKTQWFLGWLRGMTGLLLLVSVIALGFIAFDMSTYRQLTAEQKVATIRFKKIAPQRYLATFTPTGQTGKVYELLGDQWQLDSRVVKWSGVAVVLGMKTGYRLDRLSGRYLSLADERSKPRKLHSLNNSPVGIDTWLWVNKANEHIHFVDAKYGSGVFLPMSHGSVYQISLTTSGLIARASNQAAKEAISLWQ